MNSAALEKRLAQRIEEARAFGIAAEAGHAAANRIDAVKHFSAYRARQRDSFDAHRAAMRRYDRAEAIASIIRCGFARLQGHGVITPAAA